MAAEQTVASGEFVDFGELQNEDVKVPIAKGEGLDAAEGEATYFVDENGQYYTIDTEGMFDVDANNELFTSAGEAVQVADGGETSIVAFSDDATEHATAGTAIVTGETTTDVNGVSYVVVMQPPGVSDQIQMGSAEVGGEEEEDDEEEEDVEVDKKPEPVQLATPARTSRRLAARKGAKEASVSPAADEDQQLAVYDFDDAEADEEGLGALMDEEFAEEQESDEDVKPRVAGAARRSAQNAGMVSQHHMCNYCNYTTSKRYLLSRHLKTHSVERPHKCSVCERGFKTLASLQNHVNTHTGTKPHKCRYCEAAFTTSGELTRHVRYRHTLEKPHQCTECDYSTVELSKLKRHMRAHTGERPYQCPHCTYASPDTFKLKRHLRIHTGERPYECDMCHARFTQSNSLKAHRLIHTGTKPLYKCELCPATCGRKTDLRIHVQKLHMSEKPIKCKRCGKSFPDRYSFKLHSKTHEGEKCFRCDLCDYASTSQRHLESHMLIHTNQKPYQCEICQQSFRQKQLLKRHLNLYHNPHYVPPAPRDKTHECPQCQKSFSHKGNLMRHMESHDPDASSARNEREMKMARQQKRFGMTGGSLDMLDRKDSSLTALAQLHAVEGGGGRYVEVDGKDGEKFVVLEVIEMENDDEGSGAGGSRLAVKGKPKKEPAGIFPELSNSEEEDGDEDEEDMDYEGIEENVRVSGVGEVKKEPGTTDVHADVSNCFGFDEEDDDGEDDE